MIGRILKEKREEFGLSQNEVAEFLSISPQSVSKWERELADPTIEYLPKLARIFECSIDDFFELDKFSGNNLDLTNSLFMKLSREGKLEESKKHLLLNSIEFEFIETLFAEIENKIKVSEERFNCADIQKLFNFGYLRATLVIDWLLDLAILKKVKTDCFYITIINKENFNKFQSLFISRE